MTTNRAIEYITDNKKVLNISSIARDAQIPEGTLRAVVAGVRPLPEEYEKPLISAIEHLRGGTSP